MEASGDRLRVTAQLIDAQDSTHVWSERYDRPANDLFAVQDDITAKIAGTLTGWQGPVVENDTAVARRKNPASLEAYDYFLLGSAEQEKMDKEGSTKARELYHKALEIDPNFEPAVRDLGITYATELDAGTADNVEQYKAEFAKYTKQAIALEPNDPLAQLYLAFVYAYYGDFSQALTFYNRALELGPHNVDVLILCAGNLPFAGDAERGPELAERAISLDPHYAYWWNYMLRWAYFFARDFDKAFAAAHLIEDGGPNDQAYLAMIAVQSGRKAEAEAAASQVRAADPEWSVELYADKVGGFAREKEINLLIESARKAGLLTCMTKPQIEKYPDAKHLKTCDEERLASK